MRIGIDASRAAKKQKTGTETYSYYLIRELIKLDQQNEYILYTNKKLPNELRQYFGAHVKEKIVSGTFLWSQLALPRAAYKDQLDVLFVPSHVLPKGYKGKSVLTIHGLEYEQYGLGYRWLQKAYLRWTTTYGAKQTTRIITPSTETKKLLGEMYGADLEKITVIPHGSTAQEIEKRSLVNESVSSSEKNSSSVEILSSSRKQGSHKGEEYFLFVGSLEPRKNLETLLKAFVQFKEAGFPEKLIVAGRKTDFFSALFEMLVPEENQKDVEVLGYVDDEEYICLLKNAKALILPSLAEGFGMPVLDAAQYGVPVIGSDHGFFADFYLDSVLRLQDEGSTDELFQKMQLASKEAIDAVYFEKKKKKAEELTWERAARKTLDILSTVN